MNIYINYRLHGSPPFQGGDVTLRCEARNVTWVVTDTVTCYGRRD